MMLHAEDKPHSLVALEALINARLPLVELPDVLMEVDGWTGFSGHLEHADGAEPRAPELLVHCHASILAQACNFGLTRMAQLADLSYRQLAWCTTWYLREETLKPAIAGIVNRHYRHPLARLVGRRYVIVIRWAAFSDDGTLPDGHRHFRVTSAMAAG
jgi:hypothetical protein